MSWSKDYKKSIDCNNPKGFSQKAHCAGRKARQRGETTKSKSVNEMKLTKEQIIDVIMEGVDDPGILKCVFMAGGPGSGKSFTAKEIFGVGKEYTNSFSATGLKVVNSDTAFEKGLKDNGINPKDLGRIEKEEPELWDKITKNPGGIRAKAKALTQKQQKFYEAGRLGMIIDGTGDDFGKIKKKVKHAKSLGYDCYMVFVNTSLEVALERNRNRERTLSDELVTGIWKDCQQNLGKFQGLFGGNMTIVDNTVYKPIDKDVQKSVDRFVRMPIYNPIGKEWIKTARALKKAKLIKAGKEVDNKPTIEERINLFVEENVPTDPQKWAYAKSQAKKKFDVYPSAYANGWAAKKYKELGGGWRKGKKEQVGEAMVRPRMGHKFYQLTKDAKIEVDTGKYITGKKDAYLIDYFDDVFYVDMKTKVAYNILKLKDQNELGFKRNFIEVDKAPELKDWKSYIK